MTEFVVPRDEREIVRLFGDLLFGRWESDSERAESQGQGLKLSTTGVGFIERLGVLNRIFRRWFETTFGWNNWSKHFKGETPRQELTHHHRDLERGAAFLSVALRQDSRQSDTIPHFFSWETLEQRGGLISYGLHQLAHEPTPLHAPYFDPDFTRFARWLSESERRARRLRSYRPPAAEAEKYWLLFWIQCGAMLAYALAPWLMLPKRELVALADSFQGAFEHFVQEQGSGPDDFIDVDAFLYDLWELLRMRVKALVPYERALARKTDAPERFIKNPKNPRAAYSVGILYQLGVALDESILFPAERYFGGLEAVWTSIDNFGQDLGVTIVLANNEGALPPGPSVTKERPESPLAETIAVSALDIKRLWFAPPTAFRVLDSVRQYIA